MCGDYQRRFIPSDFELFLHRNEKLGIWSLFHLWLSCAIGGFEQLTGNKSSKKNLKICASLMISLEDCSHVIWILWNGKSFAMLSPTFYEISKWIPICNNVMKVVLRKTPPPRKEVTCCLSVFQEKEESLGAKSLPMPFHHESTCHVLVGFQDL